ncbi:hypothetical protein TGDOM2_268260 [Toxoplasma gondii GAB2-2007-GAL-DOM2]|uniref:Uncharacterized protein n=2 Tax=Toxoplasma gondii TaxID=5811 RepID=A0A086K3Z9_TOXGO|nr:hypothetical protein TGDOM2_268260 [Toxoplasma gondii GAB2-2007-GAL-DOM2]
MRLPAEDSLARPRGLRLSLPVSRRCRGRVSAASRGRLSPLASAVSIPFLPLARVSRFSSSLPSLCVHRRLFSLSSSSLSFCSSPSPTRQEVSSPPSASRSSSPLSSHLSSHLSSSFLSSLGSRRALPTRPLSVCRSPSLNSFSCLCHFVSSLTRPSLSSPAQRAPPSALCSDPCLHVASSSLSSPRRFSSLRLSQKDARGSGYLPAQRFLSLLKASPEEYRSLLREATQAKIVDPAFLRVASQRFFALSDRFYPPEILDILSDFASFPYSDEALLAAVAGRLEDQLVEPSPKRLAALLSLSARLGLCHPSIRDPLTKHIEEKMYAFDAALLASLCRTVGSLLSPRLPLLDGLATQAQLLASDLRAGEQSLETGDEVAQRRRIALLFRCLEGLSRQRYSHSALVDACVACAEQHGQAFPLHDTLRAVAAARRLDLGGIEEPLRRSGMADKVNRATDRGDQLLALLRHLDLLRLRDSQLLQKVSEAVELHSQKAAFLATQLPEALLHLTRLAPADLRLPVALLSQPSLLAMAPRLSAAQLQQLLSASALVLFQHIQRREGGQGGDPLIAREAEALAKTVERFLDLLQPQFLSLNLRDRRALKEAASLFLVEAQGAAKSSAASPQFALAPKTVDFCCFLEEADVAPPLPLAPSGGVDFQSVGLVEACSRLVLCADARFSETRNSARGASEGDTKKGDSEKTSLSHTAGRDMEAAAKQRALLFVSPRDAFADARHSRGETVSKSSKAKEREETTTCKLGGVSTDLPVSITPQAASSLLLTQLALIRRGILRHEIQTCIPPPTTVD